ncbi:universal stress protein UspA [Halorubrum saccharovorum]|uniref:Universal stress protein UspA n=1 Tax=Halorubrum saccharovorum TaxID=2248 RepID=A0A081EV62_9EURY|nr:universal stress protein [Halorubrum saccharovorum]KDS91300.1 universal stress protein UspA [Halorubrum saccharovorum]
MERALVAIEPTDGTKELAREAGTLAAGVDAEVIVVHVTTEDEYTARRQAMSSMSSGSETYTTDDASEGAAKFAHDFAEDALADIDVAYETAGYVGEKGAVLLDAAEEHDCDHTFLAGRDRSPTGKALFGDPTQRVLLEFDGPVTVVTA